MTDVELDYPRAEAVGLVRAAFEEAPSFVGYTVEGDDERFVGRPKGGAIGSNGEVVVRVPRDEEGPPTTITVTAHRKFGVNLTANPWKYKSEYLAGVRDLRGEPSEAFTRPNRDAERDSDDVGDQSVGGEQPSPTADAWFRAAKLSGLMLLGLLGLVLLAVVFSVVLP